MSHWSMTKINSTIGDLVPRLSPVNCEPTLVVREVDGSSSTQSVRDVVMLSTGGLSQSVASETPIREVR